MTQQSLKCLFLWQKSKGAKRASTLCHEDTQIDSGDKKQLLLSLNLLFYGTVCFFLGEEMHCGHSGYGEHKVLQFTCGNWIFVFISIPSLTFCSVSFFFFSLNPGGCEMMADFGVNPTDTRWKGFPAAAAGGLGAFLTTCLPNISVSCETACMKERQAARSMSYCSVCRPFQKVRLGHRATPQATAAFDLQPLSSSSSAGVCAFRAETQTCK